MLTLQDFLQQSETQKIKRELPLKLYEVDFYRDPNRAVYHDQSSFLSPADGVIVYAKVVHQKEEIIEVKGMNYTVETLMQETLKYPCLIIGIFMTALDVHINRIPTNGFVKHKKLPPLKVSNLSMREVERDILKRLNLDYSHMEYMLFNERVKNRIYAPHLKQPYYILQIADFEVDVISHFGDSDDYYTQGERFSVVRMGSQVDLIIPFINTKIQFESLLNDRLLYHVEAGVDRLVRINGI